MSVLLTFGDAEYLHNMRRSLFHNILYALHHGHAFVIDDTSHNHDPSGYRFPSAHFEKMYTVLDNLPRYDGVIWIDADIQLLRQEVDIFSVVRSSPDAHLTLADHSAAHNNGLFYLRSSAWSTHFVRRWIEVSQQYPNGVWQDQSSFTLVLIEHLNSTFPGAYTGACHTKEAAESRRTAACLREQLEALGRPYNARMHLGPISILPQNVSGYRINQWYFGHFEEGGAITYHHPFPDWVADDYYRGGDVAVHTKAHGFAATMKSAWQKLQALQPVMDEFLASQQRAG